MGLFRGLGELVAGRPWRDRCAVVAALLGAALRLGRSKRRGEELRGGTALHLPPLPVYEGRNRERPS